MESNNKESFPNKSHVKKMSSYYKLYRKASCNKTKHQGLIYEVIGAIADKIRASKAVQARHNARATAGNNALA
jgi:hypothetical protein